METNFQEMEPIFLSIEEAKQFRFAESFICSLYKKYPQAFEGKKAPFLARAIYDWWNEKIYPLVFPDKPFGTWIFRYVDECVDYVLAQALLREGNIDEKEGE